MEKGGQFRSKSQKRNHDRKPGKGVSKVISGGKGKKPGNWFPTGETSPGESRIKGGETWADGPGNQVEAEECGWAGKRKHVLNCSPAERSLNATPKI